MTEPDLILVGNFAPDAQQSMLRFAALLEHELAARGAAVVRVAPEPRLARLAHPYRYSGWPKLLGYVDKFVFFPRTLRRLARNRPGSIFHILDHANAVYLPHLPRRTVVTCHDLLQIRAALGELPQQPVGPAGRRYQRWILRHLGTAPAVACVSHKTRDDMLRLTPLAEDAVAVVPNGLNFPYHRLPADEAHHRLAGLATKGAPFRSDTRFLLNVGGGQWYKNRPGVLRIFAALRAGNGYGGRLLLVGKPLSPADAALARSLGVEDRLVFANTISNAELEALYALADGLLFPSWEEGFGWPILEAQACGCPVFTSNRAPMTEVGGAAAIYFDPADAETAAATIGRTLQAPGDPAAGPANAARFSTTAMVAHYRELYARAALR